MPITAQEAIEAAQGSKGIITVIARKLGCSRSHVYNLMKMFPDFAVAIKDERESMKDFAESKLYQQVDNGNMTAIIFYLKTQAKDRGYIERQEHSGPDGGPMEIAALTPAQRAARITAILQSAQDRELTDGDD